VQSWASC